jgi:DNA polymerase-1
LIEAINKGTDMHKEVASFMYQKPVEEITKDERQAAKSLNFGVIYGMGPMALSKNLDISQEEAEDKLSRYMQQFYGVKRWIDDTHAFARKHLKVVTPFGRARNLPDIGLPDRGAVSGALRQAQNAPIQATASDLTLWLLHYIYSHIDKDNAVFLVSVHDSGVYAVKDEYMDSFINILKEGMYNLNTTFTFLKVPMKIDISIAEADETGKSRWGKVEEVSSI